MVQRRHRRVNINLDLIEQLRACGTLAEIGHSQNPSRPKLRFVWFRVLNSEARFYGQVQSTPGVAKRLDRLKALMVH